MTDHKMTPDGFSIWHSRHGKRWCWRQILGVDDSRTRGHVLERTGLRTRPAAVADIYDELARRDQVGVAANAANPPDADVLEA